MKLLSRVMLLAVLVVFSTGCERKGDKGDTGATGNPGMIATKTYTGIPNANPYTVTVPELTDHSKQIVECYIVMADQTMIKLNYTYPSGYAHVYGINGNQIGLITIAPDGSFTATSALRNPDTGVQGSYRIDIKTFNTPAAAQAYRRALSPANSTYDRLIYGDELN